jgi:phenylacetate-CoA ligase
VKRILGSLVVLRHLRGQKRAPFAPWPRIEAARDARVRHIVRHAAQSVPHYRELFARLGLDPREIRTAGDLARLGLLDRATVRRDPSRLLSQSRAAEGALSFLTSGSTGTPLEVHHDRESLLANIAWGERERASVIALCGTGFRPRELHIGYANSNFRKVLAFYAENTRLPRPRRTPISMTLPFEAILAELEAVKPDVLTAYGGFLDVFFRTVEARGLRVHRPKVVMYVGERLPAERRAFLERELGARVLSRYCSVEAFKVGYFCEAATGFHIHEDLCHVRVVRPDGRDAAPGEAGEIVISNLVNRASVLLNYPTGDVAALSAQPCPCGRSQRLLSEVEGRLEDMLPLPTGETLHPRAIWAAFKDDRTVLQYQLTQLALDRFQLKLVTAREADFTPSRERALLALRPLLGGSAAVDVTWHAELGRAERERTGKFRAVESRVRRG